MTEGLRVLITVVVVDVLALLFDLVLLLCGHPTITMEIVKHRWFGAPLVAWNVWGAVGLFSHFYLEQ